MGTLADMIKARRLLMAYSVSQATQRLYFNRLYARGYRARTLPTVNAVMMPQIDKAEVLAVFIDDAGGVHIVWSDEYFPEPHIDEYYRRYRREKFGRTADVESIHVMGAEARYPTTCGEGEPYTASVHMTCTRPWEGVVWLWTWNHLMGAKPSPYVKARGGYRKVVPEIMRGTREDAEDYAKEHS